MGHVSTDDGGAGANVEDVVIGEVELISYDTVRNVMVMVDVFVWL
jgi:hypothetical protein